MTLLAVNERFAQQVNMRGVNLQTIITVGGHDWRSWNAALPDLFASVEKTLR